MPHSDRAAVDGFIAELRQAWTMAGPPSYQDFEKLSTRVSGPAEAGGLFLSRSTTQDILAGRRQQPPKWRWVARFITVLHAAAAEVGVDPASLGSLAEWKEKHEAAGTEDAPRDAVLAALLRTVGQRWWRDHPDPVPDWMGTYLSLEPAASLIRAYDTTLVPGLLQTEEYADAAIRAASLSLGQAEVSRLVGLRMRRQQLLMRPGAPRLWAIMDETAVRRRLGSVKTMRAQISRLIDISQRPNVTVQVIPSDTSVHAVAGGPITFLRFPRADSPDVVYLEQLTGALYLTRSGDVSHYGKVLSRLGIEALDPVATTDFLREILMEI